MQQMMLKLALQPGCIMLMAIMLLILSSCGGGGGGSGSNQLNPVSQAPESSSSNSSASLSSISSSKISSTSSSSSQSSDSNVIDTVTLSGTITYDFIPHNLNHIGLNYSAIEQRPVRGAVVELLDDVGQVKSVTSTANDGSYSFTLPKNSLVKVRAKAHLFKSSAPSWNFKVTDNTSNNALYVLDGALASVGSQNSKRNLNAVSGWDGMNYSAARAAAPFAILDNIYTAANRVVAAGNTKNLSSLELRWSTKNSVAEGDASRGEIGTSYYDGSAIYILGDANNDTDEYDPHVLLHEWGHYLEREIYRSDSVGGSHADGDSLDLRVAMSEGFANAFSGMMINDVSYADASGVSQASGFFFSIGRKNRINKGFFSEGSIGSVLFNYYSSNENKTANDFSPIHKVLSSASYIENDALTSIYLFYHQLKNQFPNHSALFGNLLQEQNIFGTDEYGLNESNSGGSTYTLPVYRSLTTNNVAVNVCSTADFGKQNKLGNSQFLKLNIAQAGIYNLRLNKSGGADVASKPEFILYHKGAVLYYLRNNVVDTNSGNLSLAQGNYILEVYDSNNQDAENTEENTTCFNVRATATI
ncbi:hypothetical protein GCM10011613_13640 [Cellvibrio zantedeschiae]|uniref:Lipoprotein n=1 Tax=Cellvibrio zantedeschiae TaxID=1237077 RepID=A0ABQ3AWY4_9GAMM|nr:hypothetical protein [Cellvibrio zantedeschiae]GGY70448.1 hypothetical protein GCM10011613_13640 [Cellvibrio zantedeschiae]